MKKQVGNPLNSLRQAWFGEYADRVIAIRYDAVVDDPSTTVRRLYELLDLAPLEHDFENLVYSEPEFDESVGMPGLHDVRKNVEPMKRKTILPPDLFAQYNRAFWELPGQNPRGVTLL